MKHDGVVVEKTLCSIVTDHTADQSEAVVGVDFRLVKATFGPIYRRGPPFAWPTRSLKGSFVGSNSQFALQKISTPYLVHRRMASPLKAPASR